MQIAYHPRYTKTKEQIDRDGDGDCEFDHKITHSNGDVYKVLVNGDILSTSGEDGVVMRLNPTSGELEKY